MVKEICIPANENESVIEIIRGPFRDYSHGKLRWVWTFVKYWWDTSPAICGKCGRCTNPDNVTPCGHPEAERCVRGQVFLTDLDDTEKRIFEGNRTVRYVREGRDEGTFSKRGKEIREAAKKK